ncbi:MAG: hypothetical protein V4726_18685 [Verrucomicrobiota bacterium]
MPCPSREGLDYALGVGHSALRSRYLLAWGSEADAASVLRTCLRMPEGADREILLEAFGNNSNTWSMDTEDLRPLLEKEPPERITEKMATAVGASCAARNPEAALSWAGTLPAERRRAAAEAIFRNWDNRIAAAKALDQLPEGSFKSKARQAWYYLMPRTTE